MAGHFSIPKEEDLELISLDDFLIQNREATYMLNMENDSFNNIGIYKGDIVLVQKNLRPKIGNLVITFNEDEFKIKIFEKDFSDNVEAIVISIIRKYV